MLRHITSLALLFALSTCAAACSGVHVERARGLARPTWSSKVDLQLEASWLVRTRHRYVDAEATLMRTGWGTKDV